MKMTNGTNTVETTEFLKNIWTREGYTVVEEVEELSYDEMKDIAKENGIKIHGMKKDELLEAIKEYI